jgi:predicted Zn-dependent protease
MDKEAEKELGQEIHRELIKSGELILLEDQVLTSYVNSITQKLARFLTNSDPSYYSTFIAKDASANAFATAGGFSYVTSGLLTMLSNEASLAAVIAHELSHLEQKHLLRTIEEVDLSTTALSLLNLKVGGLDQIVVELGLHLRNSRLRESSADRGALAVMKQSDYAAAEILKFFMMVENTNPTPEFLSTHPSPTRRLDYFRANIGEEDKMGNGLDSKAYRNLICARIACP